MVGAVHGCGTGGYKSAYHFELTPSMPGWFGSPPSNQSIVDNMRSRHLLLNHARAM